jgi:hypothetical protein
LKFRQEFIKAFRMLLENLKKLGAKSVAKLARSMLRPYKRARTFRWSEF